MSKKTAKDNVKKKNVLVEEKKTEKILTKIFGDPQKKVLKRLQKKVEEINALAEKFAKLDDEKLKAEFTKLQTKVQKGSKTLDEVLPEVFAIVREASSRTLEMRHFDVQLIGGMILHSGAISEMKTGEGKTITSSLPVILNALDNHVHVVTVNPYLAKRDKEELEKLGAKKGDEVKIIFRQDN
jgi:preprotein translocase subunit SecA